MASYPDNKNLQKPSDKKFKLEKPMLNKLKEALPVRVKFKNLILV